MPGHQELSGRLGRYVIRSKLGAGGMGTVYLAEDSQLGRKVALKVPHLTADDRLALERFRREARLAAGIEHPNLCPVFDIGEADGVVFFTMPFIEGTPLSRLIEEGKPWPPLRAMDVVRKVAVAVSHLHQRGIIHRDLKPSNVLVRASGEPVLMDFGLARSFTSQTRRLTTTGKPMGSPAYMPPEQVAGARDVGPTADVYSLGMMLYELLTSRLPFTGPLMSLFAQILQEPPPAPSTFCPGLDPKLDALCLKALSKKCEARHASAEAFIGELADVAQQQAFPTAIPVHNVPTAVPVGARTQPQLLPSAVPTIIPAASETIEVPRLVCPQCGKPVSVPQTMAGRVVACPYCRSSLGRMPAAPASPLIAAGAGRRPPRASRNLGLWLLAGASVLLIALLVVWLSRDDSKAGPALKPLPREVENSIGMKLVLVPKGKFLMGSEDGDSFKDEQPRHEVEISQDFYLGATEVTVGQFRRFVETERYTTEAEKAGDASTWKGNSYSKTDDHPVLYVSWNDAVNFCGWLGRKEGKKYELPTEAEWEYACRAGGARTYCFGDDTDRLREFAWYFETSGKSGPQPVGSKKANAWGLHDMHGNVWEWCADGKRVYERKSIKDPRGDPNSGRRVLRGGPWYGDARDCRSANRYESAPDDRANYIGFRVVQRVARNP